MLSENLLCARYWFWVLGMQFLKQILKIQITHTLCLHRPYILEEETTINHNK
jgi:hypothetical protein